MDLWLPNTVSDHYDWSNVPSLPRPHDNLSLASIILISQLITHPHLTRNGYLRETQAGMPEALRGAGGQTLFEGHFIRKHILQNFRKSNNTCVLSRCGDGRLLPMLVEKNLWD